ncbi:MAG: DUF4398 domain-containing protein [Bdellovibrionales bacterium]|nr:DUF4398 domain-containing protein [Bdellovibrionales bacterium]
MAFVTLNGCSTNPPLREFAIARTALQLAKNHDAARYAPALWQEAENAFESGESLFRKGEYREAKSFFEDCQEYAERAENASRLQKLKSGEPQ